MARGKIYNNIATEEELEKVNPKNIELWKAWEVYLRNASRSPGTIKNYNSDVNIFFVYLSQKVGNKHFVDITPKDILLFQDWIITDLGMSNNRVRRLKDTLSSFSNYIATFEDYPDFKNIIRLVPSPKRRPYREVSNFTDEEVQLIFEGLINEYRYMDACAVAMAFYGGLRKSDLIHVKADWFTKDDIWQNDFYKSPEQIVTKNDKSVNIYLLKKEVDRYLYLWKKEIKKLKKKQIFTEAGEEYLFIRRLDGRWTQCNENIMTTIQIHVNNVLKSSGIEKEFYWESARNYYYDYIERVVKDQKTLKMLKNNMYV